MGLFKKTEEREQRTPQELVDLKLAVQKAQLPENVAQVAFKELERLENTDPSMAEYTIGLTYLDLLISLPWKRFTDDNLDLAHAKEVLEARHFGLHHVKERILDYLAVRTLCSIGAFHILVVDDEEIARTNLEYVLKKQGYEVDTAANGAEALECVKRKDYDLVLTDLKMEKLDGMQLLESVRKLSPHTDTVMITGYATVTSAVDAMKKGAVHYLSKPINLDELRKIVQHIKEKKKHIQMSRGPILCFTGPPGTGKTSIGKAIAEALERTFVRLSLGGMRDEAELRGHRRTYVGAMPGRIIQEIRRLGMKNPVFMLDEIDKIGQDFRGDPASVLLEILDPEQNSNFVDYYLDVPFDLSSVMFIATSNVVERLPGPLLDRLEVISFPGYTEKEKLHIARNHMIPREIKEHGLLRCKSPFTDGAILNIIRDYTREAGLRQLEREICQVCRKLARICLESGSDYFPKLVDENLVQQLLGPRHHVREVAAGENRVGVTTGLVWSEFGGEIIFVEATIMRGTQQIILTGSLGSVIKESAQTALSFIRSHSQDLGVPEGFFKDTDIHIHIPAGAIPKDGPSAGVTIAMSLLSVLTGRPARRDVAMTGELTLSGRILPVNGIREKLLAAQRAGVKMVILPRSNEVDVKNLDADVTEDLEVFLSDDLTEIVDRVLMQKVSRQPPISQAGTS
ncbi:MAG: endopeptidase La [Deltaproteobacteria bacterium]|nr:endopeptidase La [Deltaproteobacteria bacterium]